MNTLKKILFLSAILFIGNLSAQKVAYVSENKILAELKNYETSLKEIEELKKKYSEEITKENQDLDDKFKKLVSVYKPKEGETIEVLQKRMKPADAEKLESLKKENELIEQKSENYNTTLENLYKEKVQPELDKVNNAISNYAKKNKLAMVYKIEGLSSALAYVDEKLDKTEEIIKLVK